MTFQPMLAAKAKSLDDIVFPAYATPKIDGIRCLLTEAGAVTRSLKPIPNDFVRATLNRAQLIGLDGELWIEGAKTFGDVSSAIMSHDRRPSFRYLVFDRHNLGDLGYLARCHATKEVVRRANLPWLEFLQPVKIDGLRQLARYEEQMLKQGYEGIMLRAGDGAYKNGRSTMREGGLVAWKRFEDGEAVIIGFEEMLHNTNVATKDALGHTERSSRKAGMVPKGTLGKLVVRDTKTKVEFSIGTGFDDAQRAAIWDDQKAHLGMLVKFRHQVHGAKDKPRIPTFLGFRDSRDL